MRIVLFFLFFQASFFGFSQLYNLIYIDNIDGSSDYDIRSNSFAHQFTESYSGKNYLEAISYLDSLQYNKRWDQRVAYNKAICYKYLNQEDSCLKYMKEYLSFPITKLYPGMITKSVLNEWVDRDKKIKSQLNKLIKKKCRKVTNPDLYMKLEYHDACEQEILMDSSYLNNKNMQHRFARLKENFQPINHYVLAHGIPTYKAVGSGVSYFYLMVLHMDYDPEYQLELARRILEVAEENHYRIPSVLYAIDRALKNLGLEQEYGSIVKKRGTDQSEIYKYSGTLEELNTRREKYGLVPMEIEVKNYTINQTVK